MKLEYCVVRDVGFFDEAGEYAGTVIMSYASDGLATDVQEISVKVRVSGDRSWTFAKVEFELLEKAMDLALLASQDLSAQLPG